MAFIGRVAKEKSIDMVLRALPALLLRVPRARFLVVGDGPERLNLEKLAQEACPPGSFMFAGPRTWADIPDYYRAADVFVTASITETQGLTVLEAMAAEVPVVARLDPSFSSMIDDGVDGLLFSNQDTLVDALSRVLNEPSLSASLVRAARGKALDYSAEVFGESVEALYNEIIRRKTETERARSAKTNGFPRKISLWTLRIRRNLRQFVR